MDKTNNSENNRPNKFLVVAERATQSVALAMAMVFFISGIFYLYNGRWTVTHTDYWYIYDCCLNGPWLTCALTTYAGHSLFFPSLIWLANIYFFHNNQQLLAVLGFALLLLTVILTLIPVWRDGTVGRTAKLAATLILIVGNFWLVRSAITASGGFNCICSLALGGAVLAFFWLPKTGHGARPAWTRWIVIVAAGFVSSLSFGTGLSIWPTLLALGWALRLPLRSLGLLCLAGICTSVIYLSLPGNVYGGLSWQPAMSWLPAAAAQVQLLCKLIGMPLLYAKTAWLNENLTSEEVVSSIFSLWCGVAGLALAALAIVPRLIRRDLGRSSLELIGLGLLIFNLGALILIVAGRAQLGGFSSPRYLVAAVRYLFWGTLFWTGLLLVAIQRAESKEWMRWLTFLCVLAIPVLTFPEHVRRAVSLRRASFLAQSAATSLINDVRDLDVIKILWVDPEQVYRLAPEFRARRLDMYAAGLQDWIGQSETSLFDGHRRSFALQGRLRVEALLKCDDGAPAARCTGRVMYDGELLPEQLVIIDPAGKICGVARPTLFRGPLKPSQQLFGFSPNGFVGYIRHYDPTLHYFVRAVAGRASSEEKLPVQPLRDKKSGIVE
jgi:hypothetical protein